LFQTVCLCRILNVPRLFFATGTIRGALPARAREEVGGRRVCTPEVVVRHPGKGSCAPRRCKMVVAAREVGALECTSRLSELAVGSALLLGVGTGEIATTFDDEALDGCSFDDTGDLQVINLNDHDICELATKYTREELALGVDASRKFHIKCDHEEYVKDLKERKARLAGLEAIRLAKRREAQNQREKGEAPEYPIAMGTVPDSSSPKCQCLNLSPCIGLGGVVWDMGSDVASVTVQVRPMLTR
jgi:hypothetical protein